MVFKEFKLREILYIRISQITFHIGSQKKMNIYEAVSNRQNLRFIITMIVNDEDRFASKNYEKMEPSPKNL